MSSRNNINPQHRSSRGARKSRTGVTDPQPRRWGLRGVSFTDGCQIVEHIILPDVVRVFMLNDYFYSSRCNSSRCGVTGVTAQSSSCICEGYTLRKAVQASHNEKHLVKAWWCKKLAWAASCGAPTRKEQEIHETFFRCSTCITAWCAR